MRATKREKSGKKSIDKRMNLQSGKPSTNADDNVHFTIEFSNRCHCDDMSQGRCFFPHYCFC